MSDTEETIQGDNVDGKRVRNYQVVIGDTGVRLVFKGPFSRSFILSAPSEPLEKMMTWQDHEDAFTKYVKEPLPPSQEHCRPYVFKLDRGDEDRRERIAFSLQTALIRTSKDGPLTLKGFLSYFTRSMKGEDEELNIASLMQAMTKERMNGAAVLNEIDGDSSDE